MNVWVSCMVNEIVGPLFEYMETMIMIDLERDTSCRKLLMAAPSESRVATVGCERVLSHIDLVYMAAKACQIVLGMAMAAAKACQIAAFATGVARCILCAYSKFHG